VPTTVSNTPVYLRRDVEFKYDVPTLMIRLAEDRLSSLEPIATTRSFIFPSGFADAIETGYGAALGGAFAGTPLDMNQLERLGLRAA
jgi:hypothetical protein